jgi:hypothetical protein
MYEAQCISLMAQTSATTDEPSRFIELHAPNDETVKRTQWEDRDGLQVSLLHISAVAYTKPTSLRCTVGQWHSVSTRH